MTFTRTEESPFANSEVLAEDYLPDKVLGRDAELDEISEVFQQIVDNEQPVNAFIYGISGTGKTVSVKFKQQQLETALEQYDDVYATFIYQNCESLSSSYQAAIAITNEFLKDPKYDFLHDQLDIGRDTLPSSGLPKERVYDILFDLLDKLTYENTKYRHQIATAYSDTARQSIAEEVGVNFPERLNGMDVAASLLDAVGFTVSPKERKRLLEWFESTHDIQSPENVTDYVTVILDEVDRIGIRDELLYEIPRSRNTGRVQSVLPSVIGISNDIGYKESIQSKTDSSLRLKEITFKKYNASQLREILSQRAEKAFKDGMLDEEAIPLAAAFARKQGGDARYAIDLLQKAGMKGKKDDDGIVTPKHVRAAYEEKERDRVYEVTDDLSDQEKLVLAAIMYHNLRGETPISRTELYPTYKRFSGTLLNNSNVPRRVADYLKEMSQLGLIERQDAYKGPGESGFKYDLEKVEYNMIIQILGETQPTATSYDNLLPTELIESFEEFGSEESEHQAGLDSW